MGSWGRSRATATGSRVSPFEFLGLQSRSDGEWVPQRVVTVCSYRERCVLEVGEWASTVGV